MSGKCNSSGDCLNTIVEQLKSENESLFNDLSYCRKLCQLLETYRKLCLSLSTKYKSNKCIVDNMEKQFNRVYDKRREFEIKNRINNRFKLNSLKRLKTFSDSNHSFSFETIFPNVKQEVGEDDEEYAGPVDEDMSDLSQSDAKEDESKISALRRRRELILKTRLKPMNGSRNGRSRKRIRKNLSNKELLDGLREGLFVELIDEENEFISVIRQKMNEKSDNKSEFGVIVGFKCASNECLFVTYRKDSMRGHIMAKHLNERPFGCDECDKTFTTKKYMDAHKLNVHSSGHIEKLKCNYPNCQYETQFNSQMSIHVMRHKKERTFKCGECESAFCSKGDLNVHIRLVHKGDRPYGCDWPGCEASFKTMSSFNQHKAVHSSEKSFFCDFTDCGMAFGTKQRLKRHKESHDLVKRHVCCWPACDKSFARKYRLMTHMKKHTLSDQNLVFQL